MTDDAASSRQASARGPAAALVAGVLLVAAGVGVARGVEAIVVDAGPARLEDYDDGSKRLAQFVDALPQIAATPTPTAVVFGTSIGFFDLSPAQFDAELAAEGTPMTTFTSATPATAPSVQRALATRVRDAFAARHRNLDLALVELAPHNLTVATARAAGGFHRAELRDLAQVLDARRLFDLALTAPEDAAHVVALAALGNPDANGINGSLGRLFLMTSEEREQQQRAAGPQATLERELSKLGGEHYPAWSLAARGEPRWLYAQTQVAYHNLQRGFLASRPRHRARLIQANDALELHLDEGRILDMIGLVRELQAYSDQVVVWLGPRNTEWLQPTPEGLARLAAALDRLHRETDVPIVDLTVMDGVDPADFFDATHLSEHRGRPKLSKRLAEEVAKILRGGAPRGI